MFFAVGEPGGHQLEFPGFGGGGTRDVLDWNGVSNVSLVEQARLTGRPQRETLLRVQSDGVHRMQMADMLRSRRIFVAYCQVIHHHRKLLRLCSFNTKDDRADCRFWAVSADYQCAGCGSSRLEVGGNLIAIYGVRGDVLAELGGVSDMSLAMNDGSHLNIDVLT